MAVKFVVAHRKDFNNVGDMASDPLQYFLDRDEYLTIDINEIGITQFDEEVPLIIGGGGLIGNSNFGDIFDKFCRASDRIQLEDLYTTGWKLHNPRYREYHEQFTDKFQELIRKILSKLKLAEKPKFVWGAGHNQSGDYNLDKVTYPESLSNFDLVGIRDNGSGSHQWAPCPSCMHPALRETYSIKNDIIWFEHKKQLIKDFGTESIPRFINSGSNIEQTIELLGSANIVLTNSYHGAYWATLMKKRVIIVSPWSTKFHFFRHQPVIPHRKESIQSALDRATIYESALDDCIATTEKFWKKIKERI
jgi:hypothetical protein